MPKPTRESLPKFLIATDANGRIQISDQPPPKGTPGVKPFGARPPARKPRRTFSAMPAGENGLATDDPAASGAVPLRSKLTGNAYSVPRDPSIWQYGFYGHPSNQTTWENWTPWIGASTYTPRGVAQGAAAKYRLWDGAEFWLQFRIKVDPRFAAGQAQPDPNGTTSYWARKSWALQSDVSSTNQLVAGLGTSTVTCYIESSSGVA